MEEWQWIKIPLLAALSLILLCISLSHYASHRLKQLRLVHAQRARLWNWFYGFDWGDVATNNYGFAPAEWETPERFQHQMYWELVKLLLAGGRLKPKTDLLEVSCGRGGGLAHLVRHWPGSVKATGLDLSENALRACRIAHEGIDNLDFVQGSALALPFADRSFDVVVNVEASNDYGDYAGFYREVHRILRHDGVFLYCDTRRSENVAAGEIMMRDSGFAAEFRDVTANVVEACRADSTRRLALIRKCTPWLHAMLFARDLRRYAAVVGSRKFEDFCSRRRVYVMAYATKVGN